jgi:three-Cys-motif partner protein
MMDTSDSLSEDDGLYLPEAGDWSERKHQKFKYYTSMFSSSMKNKWDCRVYIDLFAGPGKWRIKGTDKIEPGSPLVAMSVDQPFDQYIFCESNSQSLEALRARAHNHFPDLDCKFIDGDANKMTGEILKALPKFSRQQKGLSLIVVDPFKASELKFETVRKLSSIYADFLFLIPGAMDIRRNAHNYTRSDNHTIDDFVGTDEWRIDWEQRDIQKTDFGVFVAHWFGKSMRKLGFIYTGTDSMEIIKKDGDSGISLYYLAFFSKNKLGAKFWNETRMNTTIQLPLI